MALVVGNGEYRHVGTLPNPPNDAKLIADTLGSLGFTLIGGGPVLDTDKPELDRVVQEFGRRIQGADVALFYYAGHGIQVRGSNYLVPVDANPTREADVDFQMLDAALVLRQMGASGSRLNIVMLDACRNNPFVKRNLRTVQRGLAQMQAPEGTLISYATQPDNVALDGVDGHSPYTRALSLAMRKPGQGIFRTFNEVGLRVKRVTGGAQQPWVSSSPIDGDFYFAGPAVSPADGPAKSLSLPLAKADPAPILDEQHHAAQTLDLEKVKLAATERNLKFPSFKVEAPAADLSPKLRRFIGVWVSEAGFNGSGRHAMLIITGVTQAGTASGIYVWGPPTPGLPADFAKVPAGYQYVSARIAGDSATFEKPKFQLTVTLKADGTMQFAHKRNDGFIGKTDATPIWRFATAN